MTRATGSLPVWQKPDATAVEDLSERVRSVNPSIFIIGRPAGGYGTGFVISREHRLIATNAHVADIGSGGELMAIRNNSSDIFKVDQVWYHPGVIRKSQAGINIRSQNPSDGGVFAMGPDVAVLHLEGDKELPAALPIAESNELDQLFGHTVGMIGFPGHDTVHWPQLGEKAEASYGQGVINRMSDFRNDAGADPTDLQFLRHSIQNFGGFSGSPIFLPNGHVIALNNSARSEQDRGITAQLSFGVRIDCLWELLAFHKLTGKVRVPVSTDKLRLARFEGDDPALIKLKEVNDLLGRESILNREEKYLAAAELCQDAIRKLPNYARAHSELATNYNNYIWYKWDGYQTAKKQGQLSKFLEYHRLAVESSEKAAELEPTNTMYLLNYLLEKQNLLIETELAETGDRANQPQIRAIIDKLLQNGLLPADQRGRAFTVYAATYNRYKGQLPWRIKAVEADPYTPAWYENRAFAYEELHQKSLAASDRARARELNKANTLEVKAQWLYASEDKSADDKKQAIEFAKEACEITDYEYWSPIATLAYAYAETGDFDNAVKWGEKALKLAPEEEKSNRAARLRSYRNHKPWRG